MKLGSYVFYRGQPMHGYNIQLLTEVQKNIGKGITEYEEVLSWVFEKLGITHFSYVYVGNLPSEIDEAVILGNYPQEWVKLYQLRALFRQDPIMSHSSMTSTAFFWKDVIQENSRTNNIFDLSAQYGIEQGFSIPVHEPGCAFGSMHFSTCKENSDFPIIIKNHANLITIVSYIAHQFRPALARREPYQRFTEREVECLQWIAMGKSYGEIALILEISERTVKFHAQNIINKMEAVNIKQALTKALRLNLF